MDSITHLFLGGAIAAAIAPAKYRRVALLAGAVINTLPDLDVLPLALVEDPVMVMTWHRGATHSLLVLPWVAGLLWWLLKSRWQPVREAPLRWFTHGFLKAQRHEGELVLADLRMGAEPDYSFRFVVARDGAGGWQPIPPRQLKWPWAPSRRLPDVWYRIWQSPAAGERR